MWLKVNMKPEEILDVGFKHAKKLNHRLYLRCLALATTEMNSDSEDTEVA